MSQAESRQSYGRLVEKCKVGGATRHHEFVVLLHGLAAPKVVLWPLHRYLRDHGYRCFNWGYPSTKLCIADHARELAAYLRRLHACDSVSQIHLVTHSLGGIIARDALCHYHFPRLSRMVMLGPPNRGSHVARLLTPFLGRLWKPLGELSDEPNSYVNQLASFQSINKVEFGIVEASYDAVICPENVSLEGQSDHIRVASRHGTLPWKPEVKRLVLSFLKSGRFRTDSPESHHPSDDTDNLSRKVTDVPTAQATSSRG